jgi:hypothetical protein
LATTTFAKKKTCIRPKHACKGATIIKFKQWNQNSIIPLWFKWVQKKYHGWTMWKGHGINTSTFKKCAIKLQILTYNVCGTNIKNKVVKLGLHL